jgi:hypothetical protein
MFYTLIGRLNSLNLFMKNLILIFLYLAAYRTDAQTYKYKAVQFICTRFQNHSIEPPEIHDLKDMPVEFNMDSSILYIHSPNIQVFHIGPNPLVREEKDSIVRLKFNATDNHGSNVP